VFEGWLGPWWVEECHQDKCRVVCMKWLGGTRLLSKCGGAAAVVQPAVNRCASLPVCCMFLLSFIAEV
jgi:hypothetical protein